MIVIFREPGRMQGDAIQDEGIDLAGHGWTQKLQTAQLGMPSKGLIKR